MSAPVLNAVLRTAATKATVSQASRSCLVNTIASSPSLSIGTSRGMGGLATRHGNDPEILERGKETLGQHHSDSRGWQEEVASDSEAFVKAIRREVRNTGEDIETITRESEKVLKESRVREGHENKS